MSYIEQLKYALENIKFNGEMEYEEIIFQLKKVFQEIKRKGKRVYFIGNGGSAGIADHMTTDFLKNGGMKTNTLYSPATLTCLGNDFGYEYIFSKQLEILAEEGDLLVAISSSGNSMNIVNAIDVMHNIGGIVITFSGFTENNMIRQMGDYNIYVPKMEYGIVESIHNLILQQVVDSILAEDGIGIIEKQ